MVAAAFIPRLNSGSWPTSRKFIDVPGVPPPGPTVTPSGCATTPRWDTTPPEAPATGAAASSVTARPAAKDTERGRGLIARTSLYGNLPHAIPPRPPAEERPAVPRCPIDRHRRLRW